MLAVLRHPVYARLFLAQVIALLGTGLLTVALGLLAFDLAGDNAGMVLGTAFAIKMLAYIGLAPIASAIANNLPRKALLIGADVVRAAIALLLPFIDAVWQIYLLIFVLQAASATFTPTFQALIPDILKEEKDYTNALSLSRLAYDLENIVSPALAGLLLTLMSYHWLFSGTFIGFVGSATLIFYTIVPIVTKGEVARSFFQRLTRGSWIYMATPRLRGLLALNLAAAAVGAFVLVNSVVMVRAGYGASDTDVAYALMTFGGGSMLVALSLPQMLETISERTIMVGAALLLAILSMVYGVYALVIGMAPWGIFLLVWAVIGALYSAVLTPAGRLLRNSAHGEDRPAIFAAQFALSHACWLFTYLVAGWVGQAFGLATALMVLGGVALFGTALAIKVWPRHEHKELEHEHGDLPLDHPHMQEYILKGKRHRHVFVIDDEHRVWPTNG